MKEIDKSEGIGMAAMKAGMDRKTARKYRDAGKLPSQMRAKHDWRTRTDPFAEDWDEVEKLLRRSPGLNAKTIFEHLRSEHPGRYEEGSLRTLQRRLRDFKATHGPERDDAVLTQIHRPGEALQTDFTWVSELGITIAGELFLHMLCMVVLPYSNWRWATVCMSESIASLRKGLQRALLKLGRVPEFHQTDNSTGATHTVKGKTKQGGEEQASETQDEPKSKRFRAYNQEYLDLVRHYAMTPRTTTIGAKEQNGDVEASNGAFKRELEQALLLRASREFESVAAWQQFVDEVAERANATKRTRLQEELVGMRKLDVDPVCEFVERRVRVTRCSTIRYKGQAYSVPSRLIGHDVRIHVYEDKLEVFYSGELQLSCERLRGTRKARIDYRHLVWSLVRKPGGFARYVYREEMFPSIAFRQAYDAIQTPHRGLAGDIDYLRILHLAASTSERDVQTAVELLLEDKQVPSVAAIRSLIGSPVSNRVPEIAPLSPDLCQYDSLNHGRAS